MKFKNSITMIAAGLICMATLPCHATTTIVIGDFEGPGTAQFDGWTVTGANSAFAGDDIGAIWSSTGNGALAVMFETANAYQWQLQYTDVSVIAQLADNAGASIVADVYWLTSDWNGVDGWNRWDNMSLNSDAGWKQTGDSDMVDPANPSYPGGWDPVNWGESHQRTLTWDFSTLMADVTPADIETGGWAQLNMSVNGDTGVGTSGIMYVDNIRAVIIPEPGTLALLGVGGLLMAVRRRRRSA